MSPSSPSSPVVNEGEVDVDGDGSTPKRRRFMYMTEEEDQILKAKGDAEASLMQKAKPLKPFKFRQSGGFGGGSEGTGRGGKPGFGVNKTTSKSKKDHQKQQGTSKTSADAYQQTDPDMAMVQALTQALKTDGIVRIENVLSPEKADNLRDYLVDLRARSKDEVEAGTIKDSQQRFADVLLNQNRCDLKIPLGPKPVHEALLDLLMKDNGNTQDHTDSVQHRSLSLVRKVVEYTFETYGGIGKDASLWELNCFMSNSGARRQLVHADNVCLDPVPGLHPPGDSRADEPILLTCFVALQDIDSTMGPTIWMPGTHTLDAHNRFFETGRDITSTKTDSCSPKNDILRASPAVVGAPIPKGSCVIFDPRVLHCAGENACADPEKTRALFYVSFKNPKIDNPGCPSTSGYGISTAELTLEELVSDLILYEAGEGSSARRIASIASFP
jgi:Phytanoyl-CoA dioxygenase (PhyH)